MKMVEWVYGVGTWSGYMVLTLRAEEVEMRHEHLSGVGLVVEWVHGVGTWYLH